jgi:hypothetical protein
MEGMLGAMALKSTNGQKHHTQTGLHVCYERALNGAGERNTHGGVGAGNRLRERSSTPSGIVSCVLCPVSCVLCGAMADGGGHHLMYNESLELTAPQHTAVKT